MDRRTLIQLLGTGVAGGVAGDATLRRGDDGESTTDGSPNGADDAPGNQQRADEPRGDGQRDDEQRDEGQPAHAAAADGLVTVAADGTVDETVDRVTSAIEDAPVRLVATVDHATNAASVDRSLPPTTLLLFGNPDVGTPLMQASRSVAIDLPQKLLVWDDDGETKVTYNDPRYLAERHGIDGQCERLEQIATLLEQLATAGSCSSGD